ncbi:response regulator transcription factor [Saccharibacillus sacchari]|uniref:response regulator transcription factor n=1 Tax=Saccharibacillus sacchari TaxID=456493 RepID=UPI0004BB422D|nr:response regulator [Saccharibacillus sacchari]
MIQTLIVDDEPAHTEGIMRHIDWEAMGYAMPWVAETGEEALAVLKQGAVDVLITDISMPGMSGIEMLSRCTEEFEGFQNVQTLLISGYDEFHFAQKAILLGAKAYLLKPIKPEELKQKLLSFKTELEKRKEVQTETQLLKEKVNSSMDVVQERFVADIIEGKIQESKILAYWAHIFELPQSMRKARLLVFSYHAPSVGIADPRERIEFAEGLAKIVKVSLANLEKCYIGKNAVGEVVILHLNATPDERAKIEKQFSFVRETMQRQHQIDVSIGVSREGDLEESSGLYKEVKHMLNNARKPEQGGVYYFDLQMANRYHDDQMREDAIPEIVKLLEEGKGDRAISLFHRVFEQSLCTGRFSFSYVQAFAMSLVGELSGKFDSREEPGDNQSVKMWQRIIDCTQEYELRGVLLGYLHDYLEAQSKKSDSVHAAIRKIIAHIEENHLMHETVRELAARFRLNPSYLSVLFKKETGQTLSEFVQNIRVKKAKELLGNSETKIYEAAEQMGFQNAAYFTSWFKKNVGVSPQDFKNYR